MTKFEFQHTTTTSQANHHEPREILWKRLRERSFRYTFKRDYRINGVVVSFYCPELRLIIELIEHVHELPWERHVLTQGYRLMRFTPREVYDEEARVFEQVFVVCLQLSSPA